ncbi:unnamed protein product [Adineta ricciae]|uniref:RLR CTR domain-containing protein n=1 Tax=Adineta ricciae TaxID=249248 RepID=A0A815J7W2_ADIRI|nr:unnamed protein product [Adineta ricciae]
MSGFFQESLVAEWTANLIKLAIAQSVNAKTFELTGEVSCRACGYVLGQLAQLCRHGDSYFLNLRDFYNRVEEKPFDTPEEYAKSTLTGETHCGSKECRVKLGNILYLRDYPQFSPIYPLKCKAVQIKYIDNTNGKEKTIMKKKWSTVPFDIPLLVDDSCSNDADDDNDIFYDACDSLPGDL